MTMLSLCCHQKEPFDTPEVWNPSTIKSNSNGFRRAGDQLRSIPSFTCAEENTTTPTPPQKRNPGKIARTVALWPISSREGGYPWRLRIKEKSKMILEPCILACKLMTLNKFVFSEERNKSYSIFSKMLNSDVHVSQPLDRLSLTHPLHECQNDYSPGKTPINTRNSPMIMFPFSSRFQQICKRKLHCVAGKSRKFSTCQSGGHADEMCRHTRSKPD